MVLLATGFLPHHGAQKCVGAWRPKHPDHMLSHLICLQKKEDKYK